MSFPRIHLAVDNCFASKRWTSPGEWARVVRDHLGLRYVEASADNECDPLYGPAGYLEDWARQVCELHAGGNVRVANLYSGHGTYATLGLAHTDERVRDHLLDNWLKPMATLAGRLEAGLGFFTHAFAQTVLQEPDHYAAALDDLYQRLAELAAHAAAEHVPTVGVEQMYSPHQAPWTIAGARRLIAEVGRRSGTPFGITIDVGHQCAQRRFLRPDYGKLKEWLRHGEAAGMQRPWVGTECAARLLDEARASSGSVQDRMIERVLADTERHPYLFAAYEDGDPYVWLERLGCHSPIIHLQQTDGTSSGHKPFTRRENAVGIIEPKRVLNALACAYAQDPDSTMPPPCTDIYLTLEIFSATADTTDDIIRRMRESVTYWRHYVPADGMRLDELTGEEVADYARSAA